MAQKGFMFHENDPYVRLRLEYSSPLWSPHLVKHITQIEAVQRTITSKIQGMEQYNYWERLQHLGLFSLQRRRERYQIIHIWKIYKGLIPNDLNLQFYETNRFGPKCKRPKFNQRNRHISNIKFNSFTSNGPALFNVVPASIKFSRSLNIFKNKLQLFLKSFPDNPPTPNYVSSNKNSILEWVSSSRDLSNRFYLDEEDEAAAMMVEEPSLDLSSSQ